MGRQEVLEKKSRSLRDEIILNGDDPRALSEGIAFLGELLAVSTVALTRGNPKKMERVLTGIEHFILNEATGIAKCWDEEKNNENN